MNVGTRIRELRKKKGMTILQLATAINSDVGNISRLERNKQGYSENTLLKIASALGVQVADLFLDSNETNNSLNKNNRKYINLKEDQIELLELYDSLPEEEAKRFIKEMRDRKTHYDIIFNEMLKKRGIRSLD
ncbi:helix-turn-helix domain-containing protein [Arsenophonus sp.]|uniref:helix-turn-helix domain-containing protein n=1 Tax=Arsenophonus sp. TaxID=1872640 RepID=UPI003879ACE0